MELNIKKIPLTANTESVYFDLHSNECGKRKRANRKSVQRTVQKQYRIFPHNGAYGVEKIKPDANAYILYIYLYVYKYIFVYFAPFKRHIQPFITFSSNESGPES